MIDLLKNYKDLKNAPGYAGSLRYYLAKKKLDVKSKQIFRLYLLNGYQLIKMSSNNSYKKHNKVN